MMASFNGHVDIVRILIKAKAQINIQNEVQMYVSENTLPQTYCISAQLYELHVAKVLCTCGQQCVCLSTGWMYCSLYGSSRRQS